jgi:hypothetical protein
MRSERKRTIAGALVLTCLVAGAAAPCVAARAYECLNGIRAVVHTADEIAAVKTRNAAGGVYFQHPAIGTVELARGPHDPRIGRETDAFHPLDAAIVVEALSQMHGFGAPVDVEVFILPATPLATGSSYAVDGAIVLAPGFAEVPDILVHFVTTHEMGHVLTNRFVDGHDERWRAYLELRGLDPRDLERDLPHRERPREILAEDIRFLFGSPLARASGSIENPFLAPPDAVPGLEELLSTYFARAPGAGPELVAVRAYPNPCNPVTVVEMGLPSGYSPAQAGSAVLRVYDLRGRLVREIRGAESSGSRLLVRWDGTDTAGAPAASGQYRYTLRLGTLLGSGTVVLVR